MKNQNKYSPAQSDQAAETTFTGEASNFNMMNEPSVAILILNWNTKEFLKKHLPGIIQTNYRNKQIYVIDNHSEDGSAEMVVKNFPGVHVVEMQSNLGFATGYNLCLSQVKADYYILVNSDIKVTSDFIQPVIELMEQNEDIGICQPKLLSYEENGMFEYAGAAGGWIDKLGLPFARGRVLLTIEKDHGQYDAPAQVFWASGACMFLKSSVYEKIGGFYDYYYMHQEDIDLCWRAQNEGFKIYACPQSKVFHIGGGSLSWENHLKTFLTYRNNYILLTRNLVGLDLVRILTLRLVLDFIGCIYFLTKRKPGISKAMFKAQFAFFYWLFFVNHKRTYRAKGFEKCWGVYNGTILFPYFFKNRRKYTEIVTEQFGEVHKETCVA